MEQKAGKHVRLGHGLRVDKLSKYQRRSLLKVRDGTQVFDAEAVAAVERLRAQEYVVKRGWLSPELLNESGGESDCFDDSAVHYAVVVECETGGLEAVATVRFVTPLVSDLPIFDLFPEFRGRFVRPLEVSRYISTKLLEAVVLRAVVIAHLLEVGSTGVAVISPGLEKLLTRQGMSLTRIGGPRVAHQYGFKPQVAVAIDASRSLGDGRDAAAVELVRRGEFDAALEVIADGG